MRIRDWSSYVCSSDLRQQQREGQREPGGDQPGQGHGRHHADGASMAGDGEGCADAEGAGARGEVAQQRAGAEILRDQQRDADEGEGRSEEHTSELQSLMRISYAVFCLKKTKTKNKNNKK